MEIINKFWTGVVKWLLESPVGGGHR